jgi:hypothetical protein
MWHSQIPGILNPRDFFVLLGRFYPQSGSDGLPRNLANFKNENCGKMKRF